MVQVARGHTLGRYCVTGPSEIQAILLLVTELLKKVKSVLSHIAHSARAYLGFSSIFFYSFCSMSND